ncbi:MAG: hypothetical protein HQ471_07720 [Flavobacteriales bacterium]|nr:hypothetical protein [Flavobacteriales bacterium]
MKKTKIEKEVAKAQKKEQEACAKKIDAVLKEYGMVIGVDQNSPLNQLKIIITYRKNEK